MSQIQSLNWKEIAFRLKTLRNNNKLTAERLAELISVSTSFIGLIERGETGVSVENLYKLSQVFNCSLDYIVTGNDSEDLPNSYSRFTALSTALYDCTDKEIDFFVDLAKFLRSNIKAI